MQCQHYLLTSVWRVYSQSTGPQLHFSLYKVCSAYEGCLVPIDMYLYTTLVTDVQFGPTSVSVPWTSPTSGGPVSIYDIYYVGNGAQVQREVQSLLPPMS